MDNFPSLIYDKQLNKMNRDQEWSCRATYILGHSDLAGKYGVVIKFNMAELAVYKSGFRKGGGNPLFKIPINRIVSVIGDDKYIPSSDSQSTQRPMTIIALVDDKNGDEYSQIIEFDTCLPWVIIPKLKRAVEQSRNPPNSA